MKYQVIQTKKGFVVQSTVTYQIIGQEYLTKTAAELSAARLNGNTLSGTVKVFSKS